MIQLSWNKKTTGIILIVIGYISLISFLVFSFFKLEYQLAFKNTSILHFEFTEEWSKGVWSLIKLISASIILIIIGWLMRYDQRYRRFRRIFVISLNRIWNLKKKFVFSMILFILFLIEVILAGLIAYLMILWWHLRESVIIPYLIAIFLSAILIKFLEKKVHKSYR